MMGASHLEVPIMALARPRQTPEERRAARAQTEEAERVAERAALDKMRADLPRRLFAMKKMADAVSVWVDVRLTELGFATVFAMPFDKVEVNFWTTEPWEVEQLERKLTELLAEQEAQQNRRTQASTALEKLTDAELAAIKEFKDELFRR
jgi:hypothetical protein